MKKALFIITPLLLVFSSFFYYSCKNDNEDIADGNLTKETFLTEEDLKTLKDNYNISSSMLDFKAVNNFFDLNVQVQSVPVKKGGKIYGQVYCIVKDNKYAGYIYEDLSELVENNKIGNTYLYSPTELIVKNKFEKDSAGDLVLYKIESVADFSQRKLKAGGPNYETYAQCVSYKYSTAKRACDADNTCMTMCAAADLFKGACSGAMLAAAAASCGIELAVNEETAVDSEVSDGEFFDNEEEFFDNEEEIRLVDETGVN